MFAAKVDAYRDRVDDYGKAAEDMADHMADAFSYLVYGVMKGVVTMPDPAPAPPGCSDETLRAHCALHGLLTLEEFARERMRPGFILLNKYWGVNGKRMFCSVAPQNMVTDTDWLVKFEAAVPKPEGPLLKFRRWFSSKPSP